MSISAVARPTASSPPGGPHETRGFCLPHSLETLFGGCSRARGGRRTELYFSACRPAPGTVSAPKRDSGDRRSASVGVDRRWSAGSSLVTKHPPWVPLARLLVLALLIDRRRLATLDSLTRASRWSIQGPPLHSRLQPEPCLKLAGGNWRQTQANGAKRSPRAGWGDR